MPIFLTPPNELRDTLWMIDLFGRWNMPQDEADDWRRRIPARRVFLDLDTTSIVG